LLPRGGFLAGQTSKTTAKVKGFQHFYLPEPHFFPVFRVGLISIKKKRVLSEPTDGA